MVHGYLHNTYHSILLKLFKDDRTGGDDESWSSPKCSLDILYDGRSGRACTERFDWKGLECGSSAFPACMCREEKYRIYTVFMCHIFVKLMHISEPQGDLYQKDAQSLPKINWIPKAWYTYMYIHTTLAANPWPTIRDPMPCANALGNKHVGSLYSPRPISADYSGRPSAKGHISDLLNGQYVRSQYTVQ